MSPLKYRHFLYCCTPSDPQIFQYLLLCEHAVLKKVKVLMYGKCLLHNPSLSAITRLKRNINHLLKWNVCQTPVCIKAEKISRDIIYRNFVQVKWTSTEYWWDAMGGNDVLQKSLNQWWSITKWKETGWLRKLSWDLYRPLGCPGSLVAWRLIHKKG